MHLISRALVMSGFKFGTRELDLSQTQVMGILNVTPDSFSDGGQLYADNVVHLDEVLLKAEMMVADGASILDIGGESTRPGAKVVSVSEEQDRVLPVIERIAKELDVVISVDTSTPEVMRESAKLGVGLINDVRALGKVGALQAVAETQLPVCLMHMQGNPASMQDSPSYVDVIDEVCVFFRQRIEACQAEGIDKSRIILDPGFGFGKTVGHNLRLLNNLAKLDIANLPLLVGTSRKSMIGAVLERDVEMRLAGSLATVAIAVMQGANIMRVHDVKETVDVVRMTQAVMMESIDK